MIILMATIQQSSSNQQKPSHDRGDDDRLLRWTATLFTAAVLIHGADHARRGVDTINLDVFWLGASAIALEVAVVVLAFQRHRLAPLVAIATGFPLAVGYLVVHFLPERTLFSDSFTSGDDVSLLSWSAASLETVAAMVLGIAGLAVMRRRGGLASAGHARPEQAGWRSAAVHPVALAMILGNGVLLAVSVAQL